MIVFNASAAIEMLLRTLTGRRVEARVYSPSESLLHASQLIDLEVAQVLRRNVAAATIASACGKEALQDLRDLSLVRYPHEMLLERIWELRDNLTAYDAAYVALAEKIGARLVTRDGRLASASGHTAAIELF